MNQMRYFKLTAVVLSVIFIQSYNAQKEPCYKKKKICNFQFLTNCYEKVAFDSITQRY